MRDRFSARSAFFAEYKIKKIVKREKLISSKRPAAFLFLSSPFSLLLFQKIARRLAYMLPWSTSFSPPRVNTAIPPSLPPPSPTYYGRWSVSFPDPPGKARFGICSAQFSLKCAFAAGFMVECVYVLGVGMCVNGWLWEYITRRTAGRVVLFATIWSREFSDGRKWRRTEISSTRCRVSQLEI